MKNKIHISILLLISITLFAACKEKDLPPGVAKEVPVFVVKGEADGSVFELTAGDDAYFMHTSYSYDPDLQIYTFEGELKATANQAQLGIYIRDTKQRGTTEKVEIREVLKNGKHVFRTIEDEVLGYNVDFKQNDVGPTAAQSIWTFEDGTQSLLASPSRQYGLDSTHYNVKLETVSLRGCKSILQQEVYPGATRCQTDFKISGNTSFQPNVLFEVESARQGYRFQWDFGDGNSTSGQQAQHQYLGLGVYAVCLKVSKASSSCQQRICKNVIIGNIQACPANFTYTSTPILSFDTLGLSQLTIVWTDASGTAWRSDTHHQPSQSQFSITQNETYKANSQGDPTAKFHFTSLCRLWSENDSIDFNVNMGVFGVAYPE